MMNDKYEDDCSQAEESETLKLWNFWNLELFPPSLKLRRAEELLELWNSGTLELPDLNSGTFAAPYTRRPHLFIVNWSPITLEINSLK